MRKEPAYSHLSVSILVAGILSLSSFCFAANPFVTSIYTADPSAHVWSDGRLYVYPSRDIDPPRGCDLMDRYHVFSTDDMVNWRDEGEILRASQISWGRPEGGFMWAPDCAYRNGIYYFYFPHPSGTDWNKTWKIGIATSTEPARGFKPLGYIEGLDGKAMIDPSVFRDTDGQPYLYYGGGGVCKGGKLKENMSEIDGSMQDMVGLVDFHEATWVFKRNGTYYLTYADNTRGFNRLRYATGSSALGPWTHKGVYLESTGCDTSHGSVVEYKGQWYAFYHNQALSGKGNLRSICVDQLKFNEDGTIQTVKQTTTGVPSVHPAPSLDRTETKYEAELGVSGLGAKTGNDSAASGTRSVKELHLPHSYLKFEGVNGGKNGGPTTIDICYASAENSKVRLTVNDVDYSFLNTLSTGGWNQYTGHSSLTVPLGAGTTNTIILEGGYGGVNVDFLTLTPLQE